MAKWLRQKKNTCKKVTPRRAGADRERGQPIFSDISAKEAEIGNRLLEDVQSGNEVEPETSPLPSLREVLYSLGVVSEELLRDRQASAEKYSGQPYARERVDRAFKQAVNSVSGLK